MPQQTTMPKPIRRAQERQHKPGCRRCGGSQPSLSEQHQRPQYPMADLFRRPASLPVTANVSVFQVASRANSENFGESSGVNMLPNILTADDTPLECKSPPVQSTDKRLNPSAAANRSVRRPRPSRDLLLDDARSNPSSSNRPSRSSGDTKATGRSNCFSPFLSPITPLKF